MKDLVRELRRVALCGVWAAAALLARVPGHAAPTGMVLNYDTAFSGSIPEGTAPWFSAVFEDIEPGAVRLTISSENLSPTEKIGQLYLNLNPIFLATHLLFAYEDGTPGVAAPQPNLGVDAFKADGDGKYDILFQFSMPPASAFGAGAHLVYTISGIAGLTARDFGYLSLPAGGHGPFYSAIHVQGINATDLGDPALSGWVAPSELVLVPEPSASVLLALGAGLLVSVRSLRTRTARR